MLEIVEELRVDKSDALTKLSLFCEKNLLSGHENHVAKKILKLHQVSNGEFQREINFCGFHNLDNSLLLLCFGEKNFKLVGEHLGVFVHRETRLIGFYLFLFFGT